MWCSRRLIVWCGTAANSSSLQARPRGVEGLRPDVQKQRRSMLTCYNLAWKLGTMSSSCCKVHVYVHA